MLKHCNEDNENPIFVVRYEDLVANPRQELEGIYKYLLDLDDLKGTNAERRLDQIMAMGSGAASTYATKTTTGKFNAHASKYTPAQVELIQTLNADHLYYFGYANHPTEENSTAFFNFKDHKPEHLAKYYGFKKDNERHTA